ncbi:unnamed protein product [Closterium sp. NIES-53]
MASLNVLTFDAEGRAVDFEVWLDDLQLFLQCDSKDGLSLFDLTSGALTTHTTDVDSTVRSQWLTRDAAARLAVRNHLPSTERAHFSQYKSARALYVAVVARYSSPTTAALSRLMLPYLFPDLAAFATVTDLVAHLRTSDARYRAALPTAFLPTNSPPMYITLYYLVTRLPNSLSSAKDPFLSLCPTELSVDLLEERLAAAEKSILAVVEVAEEVVLVAVRPRSVEALVAASVSSSCAPVRPHLFSSFVSGTLGVGGLGNVPIFDLYFDAILAAMYALADITEGDCYLRVPPDPGTMAAALGASASAAPGAVSGADLQDAWVDQFTPGGQRVTHCTCSRTGRHLAMFTRRPRSSLYTLTTAPPPVSASGQVVASSQVFAAASRSSSTSAPCSCRMASRALVSGLPRSLPPLPLGPAPTCVPCVEGRQRAPPHSSSFPPTEAPLQTLHMDVWGPACIRGQGHERYFLLVVDDYSRYTTVFPLRTKGEVPEVLIDWIRGARRKLSEIFGSDLPVLRLHSDRGGEFSSDLLRAFCRSEGIRQTFTLPASPQQNGIAERRIGMVMDVARTSMIHAAAPHFLWPFAVQYAAHQINLQPRVSLPETTPTLRWTGKVGDASAFRVWGSQAFVRDTTTDKLSSRAVPCVFLGFQPDASGWQFYHPTSRRVLSSQDVTFDESGPAPSGVSQVDPAEPVEVVVDSGAARGAETGGAEFLGVETGGAESGGAETGRAEPGGWYSRRCRVAAGVAGAGAAGGTGGTTGATGGAGAAGGGAGAGAAGGAAGAGAAGGAAGAGAAGGAAGAGAARGAAGAAGGAAGTGDPGAKGTGSVSDVSTGAARPRPYYVPLLQQVLGSPPSPGPPPPFLSPPPPESRPVSPESRLVSPASPVRPVRAGRVLRPRLPPVPGTHSMTLHPSTAPKRVPLPSLPASSLSDGPDPESDSLRAASPILVNFAAACRLDYAASLVAESASASVCPPSIGGECALGTDVLEDRQEDLECFAAASPHLVSMLLAPEGDPDALDIPTPRCYAEAIEGPYSSQWQAAIDAEMASWKSTGTYEDEVPPPGANIVSGMWIFRTSPTPKMTTLRVLLHVVAQRDYELHSLDFSTAFLQGSLHEEIWLRRPPIFTGLFLAGTQWSLRRPVYGLRQAPREWHDTLRTTLAALGFAPSTADPSLFLRTDATLPPFYVLVPSCRRDTCAQTWVHQRFGFTYSSPQSTPLPTGHSLSAPPSNESVEPSGPYPKLVGCLITSGMGLVLGGRARVVLTGHADASCVDNLATQRSSQGYTFTLGSDSVTWRSTRSSSVLSSSCEAEIYAGAMAAQELRWLTYLLTDLGEAPRSPPVLYVENKAMLALCQEHGLEHRTKHIALRYFLA